ncbi:hypothetical protein C8R46DRAFT_1342973 [Mycena filopes]|nr:hypothetical protein C8R46DRAFT_1342973 [Mycena filopes]
MVSFTSSGRPTLPPLHTLNLLPAQHHRWGSRYDHLPRLHIPKRTRACPPRVSLSSSSATSRTPSPTPSDCSSSSTSSTSTSPTSPHPRSKLRLVPSSFADADAVVVIPPSGASGQSLLLTGPALARLRSRQRPLAEGTRVHPYRFAPARDAFVTSPAPCP